MSKELMPINPIIEADQNRLLEYSLSRDPWHEGGDMTRDRVLSILQEEGPREFLVAALSAIRRERGTCKKEEGRDCVLRMSQPVPFGTDSVDGWLLAVGFDDIELWKPRGVFIKWRGDGDTEASWNSLEEVRVSLLSRLVDETVAALGVMRK